MLADPELREAIKKFSNWPTIPQVPPAEAHPLCKLLPHMSCGMKAVLTAHFPWRPEQLHVKCGRSWCVPSELRMIVCFSDVQLYIKGEFVGGSDILMGLHRSGDLRTLLSDGPKEHSSA